MRFVEPQPGRTVGLVWRRTSPRKADFIALGQIVVEALNVPPRQRVTVTSQQSQRPATTSSVACPVEYDLTAIADGTLRLGDRGHPLCTPDARPTKLQALGFVRE